MRTAELPNGDEVGHVEQQGSTTRGTEGALLGARVRAAREERGLTLRELARRAEVQVSDISRLERGLTGQPRLALGMALARALGLTLSQLLGEDERPADGALEGHSIVELRRALEAISREATRVARVAESAAASLRR
ncbi:helix-turn-helix domain-containing protein [Roseisolibacter agri]|uniref:HTH cro/C1-type domain-containing protein n=1 Tax=Roseisolibacter agri TaxID=2014610 RepID=A0AA37Q7F0_9BACT|nr:helix-turn-helix transcriptional regulator [Roseisolibacter agri]GLC23751.1 hypothetical protein rosag_02640 [Roseisolibacter agri]